MESATGCGNITNRAVSNPKSNVALHLAYHLIIRPGTARASRRISVPPVMRGGAVKAIRAPTQNEGRSGPSRPVDRSAAGGVRPGTKL
jgi:hypothetical protein